MSRVIVSVAGHIGSGKTEVCRKLSKITEWEVISAGAILRKMAIEHGMTVLEFNEFAKSDGAIDRKIDNYIASVAEQPESVIVDSRLAWHFLPNSLKVFLVVEPAIAAKRVFLATRPDENHTSIETAGIENAERQRVERQRFMELYSLDCDYWRNYDIIVDTSYARPEEAAEVILQEIRPSGAKRPACWLAPQRLIPTQPIREGETAPVDIAVYRGSYLILGGHDQVAAAIRSGKNLIGCRLAAFESETDEALVRASTTLKGIRDWEESLGLHFGTYPQWLQ